VDDIIALNFLAVMGVTTPNITPTIITVVDIFTHTVATISLTIVCASVVIVNSILTILTVGEVYLSTMRIVINGTTHLTTPVTFEPIKTRKSSGING
jgi:hypothetical protein